MSDRNKKMERGKKRLVSLFLNTDFHNRTFVYEIWPRRNKSSHSIYYQIFSGVFYAYAVAENRHRRIDNNGTSAFSGRCDVALIFRNTVSCLMEPGFRRKTVVGMYSVWMFGITWPIVSDNKDSVSANDQYNHGRAGIWSY